VQFAAKINPGIAQCELLRPSLRHGRALKMATVWPELAAAEPPEVESENRMPWPSCARVCKKFPFNRLFDQVFAASQDSLRPEDRTRKHL
jgi:hypothetical protein